ncbi:MAG: hypothetical protein D6769_03770, partial [Methanobacteriota archaeon]
LIPFFGGQGIVSLFSFISSNLILSIVGGLIILSIMYVLSVYTNSLVISTAAYLLKIHRRDVIKESTSFFFPLFKLSLVLTLVYLLAILLLFIPFFSSLLDTGQHSVPSLSTANIMHQVLASLSLLCILLLVFILLAPMLYTIYYVFYFHRNMPTLSFVLRQLKNAFNPNIWKLAFYMFLTSIMGMVVIVIILFIVNILLSLLLFFLPVTLYSILTTIISLILSAFFVLFLAGVALRYADHYGL